jgi:hypothetical protein
VKLALCTISALATALALALAAGCSVNHRSDDFACDSQQRCANGRTCVDGLCVVAADSGVVDTLPPPGDAAVCPSQCTSCNLAQKTCTIDCALNNGACNQAVTCPAGWICNVACSVNNQCNSGVSCGNATSCTIACSARQTCKNLTCGRGTCNVTCSGNSSCGNSILCGTGACNVTCSGNLACGGEVTCGPSCACDVTCRLGAAACAAVTCKPGCTGMPPAFCISTANGCNTCL